MTVIALNNAIIELPIALTSGGGLEAVAQTVPPLASADNRLGTIRRAFRG